MNSLLDETRILNLKKTTPREQFVFIIFIVLFIFHFILDYYLKVVPLDLLYVQYIHSYVHCAVHRTMGRKKSGISSNNSSMRRGSLSCKFDVKSALPVYSK